MLHYFGTRKTNVTCGQQRYKAVKFLYTQLNQFHKKQLVFDEQIFFKTKE